jgi:hypothetical protein
VCFTVAKERAALALWRVLYMSIGKGESRSCFVIGFAVGRNDDAGAPPHYGDARNLFVAQSHLRCQSSAMFHVTLSTGFRAPATARYRENHRMKRQLADLPHRVAAPKPAGGFVFISAKAILAAWWALSERHIALRDLRVWLACFELSARRQAAQTKRRPRYTVDELHKLVGGVGGAHIRKSIRRLEAVGLLTWTETAIHPGDQRFSLPSEELADFEDWVSGVTNHDRHVPVPRKIIRHLAGTQCRADIATAFGHLLRCLYYRNKRCNSGGRCKARWIADTFGIHLRTVKAARSRLVSLGWLLVGACTQTQLNRWGPHVVVNLAWDPGRPKSKSPPRETFSTTELPPPIKNSELFYRRSETHEPATRRPVGVAKQRLEKPVLHRIALTDLKSPKRLDLLCAQAVKRGIIGSSQFDRLQFFSAARHALNHGTSNPPGLFNWLIRLHKWEHITCEDEDQARRILKRIDFGDVTRPAHQESRRAPSKRAA